MTHRTSRKSRFILGELAYFATLPRPAHRVWPSGTVVTREERRGEKVKHLSLPTTHARPGLSLWIAKWTRHEEKKKKEGELISLLLYLYWATWHLSSGLAPPTHDRAKEKGQNEGKRVFLTAF